MITYAENGGSTGVSLTMSDDGKLQLRYNGALSKDEISLEMIRDARSIAEKFLQTLKGLEAPAVEAKRSRLLAELAALGGGEEPKKAPRRVGGAYREEVASKVIAALEARGTTGLTTPSIIDILNKDAYVCSGSTVHRLMRELKDTGRVEMDRHEGVCIWRLP